MCNHEAQKCNFRHYLLLLKKCVLSFPVPINYSKQMIIFGQICRKKSDFWLQRSEIRQVTTHHISKRWWSLWSFQLSGWWNLIFFLPKHFRTKKNYISFTTPTSTSQSSFPASGPFFRYLIGSVLGRRVMRRKLEPMSPFGGKKRLTRYLGPLKLRLPAVIFTGVPGWHFFVFFLGGKMYENPEGETMDVFFIIMAAFFFLYEWICWLIFWILELASVISQHSALEFYQHCQEVFSAKVGFHHLLGFFGGKRWLRSRCTPGDAKKALVKNAPVKTYQNLLLMEEILHHLGCINPVNHGINYLSTGAGFQPSTVSTGAWFWQLTISKLTMAGWIFRFSWKLDIYNLMTNLCRISPNIHKINLVTRLI